MDEDSLQTAALEFLEGLHGARAPPVRGDSSLSLEKRYYAALRTRAQSRLQDIWRKTGREKTTQDEIEQMAEMNADINGISVEDDKDE